jgi:hypothetical protein
LGRPVELPADAINEPAREQYFHRQRECDPLGRGVARTGRRGVIKGTAEGITRARRAVVEPMSGYPG